MTQELGPLQKKWVEALRSGKYKQGSGYLRSGDRFCCLGVACDVLGHAPEPVESHLPPSVMAALRFHDNGGQLRGMQMPRVVSKGPYPHEFLVNANDCGETFAVIADFVEAHPEAVFREPA